MFSTRTNTDNTVNTTVTSTSPMDRNTSMCIESKFGGDLSGDREGPTTTTLTWESVSHPSFPAPGTSVDLGSWLMDHSDPSALWHGIVDVPMLSEEGCERLRVETLRLIDSTSRTRDMVGNMQRYSADLGAYFEPLIRDMSAQVEVLLRFAYGSEAGRPGPGGTTTTTTTTTTAHFPQSHAQAGADPVLTRFPPVGVRTPLSTLAIHSAHAIAYGTESTREQKLKLHVDDSLFTVNVCLGKEGFQGSEIFFTGAKMLAFREGAQLQRRLPRGTEASEIRVMPVPGRVLLHLGSHPHRTVKISSGERTNWVLWYYDKVASSSSSSSSAGGESGADHAGAGGASPGAGAGVV
jgi:hypothetical protein